MGWTQEQMTALEQAIAGGRLTVRYEDQQVTYRSLDEMMRILNQMRRDLGGSGGNSSRKFPRFGKGLRGE